MLSAQAKALDDGRQLGSLADGALGVQLRRHVGTAYDVHRLARRLQTGLQLPQGLLSGADDHLIHRQALLLFAHLNVKPLVVDSQVLHAGEHLHLAVLEHGAVDPAGGLAQAVADLGLLALQQEHFTGRGMGRGASMPVEMTREQHMKFVEERFTRLDANKDGNFTAADDLVIKLTGVGAVSETFINF